LARALDHWWDEVGRPDPFVVVEAGAGPGALVRAVIAAAPECATALRYVLVERSPTLLASLEATMPIEPPALVLGPHTDDDDPRTARGPMVTALAELPAQTFVGVVLANELLDNLPFLLLEKTAAGWDEIRVGETEGAFHEVSIPAAPDLVAEADVLAPDARPGGRIPLQRAAAAWVRDALGLIERGRLVVIDYARTTRVLGQTPWQEWVRTYRAHERAADPLAAPGTCDITCDVAIDQLPAPTFVSTQADLLVTHGIDDLVEEGRAVWRERAAIGDLAAIRARSRVNEAAALLDPAGLGAFTVGEWRVR
jgi:SAM-dependent MidA family methyltransferase